MADFKEFLLFFPPIPFLKVYFLKLGWTRLWSISRSHKESHEMRADVWLQRSQDRKAASETVFCPQMWLNLLETHLQVRCSTEAQQKSEDGCEGWFSGDSSYHQIQATKKITGGRCFEFAQ